MFFILPSTFLAFGPFTSGWMLLWGLAAAVPILLHLLNRRRQRTVVWAAMQFLAEAMRAQARRIRLWQMLLLLLRVLAIVLIALAVADPVLRDSGSVDAASRAAKLHVLVIDTSFSMRARSAADGADGPLRWQDAQQAALAAVDAAAQGDGILLIALSDPPLPVLARATFDQATARQAIAGIEPGYGTADVEATLRLVEALIEDARETDAFAGGVELTFFSDMQETTWQPIAAREPTARWQPLAASVAVELVDVTDRGTASADPMHTNLAITELHARPSVVFADRPVQIEATVMRSGGSLRSEPRVQLRVDGQLRASQVMPAQATELTNVPFRLTLPPGESVVTAEVDGDVLPVDDQRSLVLHVPDRLRVLCVGPPSRTRYLAAAIEPVDEPWVEVTEIPAARFATVEEQVFDVVVMCDVRAPTERFLRWLEALAERGTGLLWWLGAAADEEAYETLSTPRLPQVLPVHLQRPTDFDTYAIDPREYTHPIAAAFADFPQSGLLSTPIFRYWKTSLREETAAGSHVALGVGVESDPLLLTFAADENRVAVFTSAPSVADGGVADAADEPWNALVAWPSFVPLVQETMRWLAASRFERPSQLVGDVLSGTAPSQQACVQRVQRVGGDPVPVAVRQQSDGRWRWSTPPITRPGIYRLLISDEESESVAVNLDPSESDLEQVIGLASPQGVRDPGADRDAVTAAPATSASGVWFRWLLLGAFGLLLTETWLSRTMLGWRR